MVNPESSISDKEIIITKDNRDSEYYNRSVELGRANNDYLRFVVDEIIDNLTTVYSYDFFYKYPIEDIERLLRQVFEQDDIDGFNVISGAFVHFLVSFPGFREYGKYKVNDYIDSRKSCEFYSDREAIEAKLFFSSIRRNQSKIDFLKTLDQTLIECGFDLDIVRKEMITLVDPSIEGHSADLNNWYSLYKRYYVVYLALRRKGYSHYDIAIFGC